MAPVYHVLAMQWVSVQTPKSLAWWARRCSINLLHLGSLISGSLHLFQRRQVVVIAETLVVVVNAESKLDHAVDPPSELGGLIEVEAGGQQGSIEKEPDQVLHCL